MDVTVLTGFLGSGKTTLLRDFLTTREGAAETAVIVNEAGEIGLDGLLVEEAGGLALTTLAGGCVCCRPGGDLADAVVALIGIEREPGAPPLRRIILETSGLAKPGPVLRQLAAVPAPLRLSVIATYDARHGSRHADHPEALAQWAGAARIVVTKADQVGPAELAGAREAAAELGPLAEVVASPERTELVRLAFERPSPGGMTSRTGFLRREPASRVGHSATTLLLRQTRRPGYDELTVWLDNLAGALGERLLRLKGLVFVEGSEHPLLIQSVGTTFAAPRPFRDPVPEEGRGLVVIGRNLAAAEVATVRPAGLFRSGAVGRLRAEPIAEAARLAPP